MLSTWHYLPALVLLIPSLLGVPVSAILLDIEDPARFRHPDTIRTAAASAAYSLQSMYTGNRTGGVPGKFPFPPYYWWESGAAWGGMIHYWHYTGDNSYYDVTYQALVAQISVTNNYLPVAEKFDEGNDDVAFWAFAAMTAAEHGYREPPPPYPSWLAICSNVFNDYITRWHTANATCGGGLKWQVFPSNNGYTYKNAISNGGFFQLAARLARYTNNQTYYSWAERIWNWSSAIGLITPDYRIFDGADETLNCSSIDHTEWSYNVAIYLYGAAALHNYTGGGNIWTTRTNGLLSATTTFLSPFSNASDIMYERQCELTYSCNTDQLSFKAYLSRWLAGTSLMAPHTSARIAPILRASALGAAAACTGAGHNVTCGSRWYLGGSDGTSGVGQSLSVVEVLYALLVNETAPPGRQGDFDTESSSGGMLCACAGMRDGSVAVMPELLGNAMCEDWGNYTFHRG